MAMTNDTPTISRAGASKDTAVLNLDNSTGYRAFRAGGFGFRRDGYFAHISFPTGNHVMSIDAFLRALMRDVAGSRRARMV